MDFHQNARFHVRPKSKPLQRRAVLAKVTRRSLSSKPRILKDESRFDRTATPVATPKQQVRSPSVGPLVTGTREPPVTVRVKKLQRDAHSARLPAPDRDISSTPTQRRPATRRAFGAIFEHAKPAIALAGRFSSKIVVVSAEQAQRERERAAQSVVQRPHLRAIGLTGRAAFEALFNHGSDTPKSMKD